MAETHPIREFRDKQVPPLSQAGFGELFGVTRAAVSRWESGDRKLDGDMLWRVARHIGVSPAALRPDLAELMANEAAQ